MKHLKRFYSLLIFFVIILLIIITTPVSNALTIGSIQNNSGATTRASVPHGFLDVVSDSVISGWAWRGDMPNSPLEVHIYLRNTTTNHLYPCIAVLAGDYRQDLYNAGIGNGYHAFNYNINWANYAPGVYEVLAFGIGENGTNPELIGSPKTYSYSGTQIAIGINNAMGDSVMVGETAPLIFYGNTSGFTISVSSSDTTILQVTSSYNLIGRKDGSATIMASFYNSSTGVVLNSHIVVNVYTNSGITNNDNYYIMNYNSGRFMAVESTTDINGANVCTISRTSSSMARWKLQQMSNKKYNLTSVYSSSGKMLNINMTNIEIRDYSATGTQDFNVYRVNSGLYEGLYVIRVGNYYVTEDSNHNVYVTMTPTNSSYWSFMSTTKGTADMFSLNYPFIDEDGNNKVFYNGNKITDFSNSFSQLGYTPISHVNSTPANAYTQLSAHDVYLFYCHGGPGLMQFHNSQGQVSGHIYSNGVVARSGYNDYTTANNRFIDNLSHNALSNQRLVISLGCSTGKDIVIGGTTYNLVDELYNYGAHFALAPTEAYYTNGLDTLLGYILDNLENGQSINQAINNAVSSTGLIKHTITLNDGSIADAYDKFSYYSRGDGMQYISIY